MQNLIVSQWQHTEKMHPPRASMRLPHILSWYTRNMLSLSFTRAYHCQTWMVLDIHTWAWSESHRFSQIHDKNEWESRWWWYKDLLTKRTASSILSSYILAWCLNCIYNSMNIGIICSDSPMYVTCLCVTNCEGVMDVSGASMNVVCVWHPARNARELNSARSCIINNATPNLARLMAWTSQMPIVSHEYQAILLFSQLLALALVCSFLACNLESWGTEATYQFMHQT